VDVGHLQVIRSYAVVRIMGAAMIISNGGKGPEKLFSNLKVKEYGLMGCDAV
jgi:hypothetical protein